MPKASQKTATKFIVPLYINGLRGQMLRMPAPKSRSREILFVYGHHASIERCYGIAEDLNQYGTVTMPDLPGFGGMDSFYKIGLKPSLDNLADYLATFVKLRYKNKRLTIIGFSFGFVIVTRMLQRYPDLTKKVDLLISAAGFAHHEDFTFSPVRHAAYRMLATVFSRRLPALFFRYVCLNSLILRLVYSRTKNAREKFEGLSREQHKQIMDFEIGLWHSNEVRTYMTAGVTLLTLDNCTRSVKLPVWHIAVDIDRYFDNHRVEQHLGVIFEKCQVVKSQLKNHGPSVILDKETAKPFTPTKIRQVLAKRP